MRRFLSWKSSLGYGRRPVQLRSLRVWDVRAGGRSRDRNSIGFLTFGQDACRGPAIPALHRRTTSSFPALLPRRNRSFSSSFAFSCSVPLYDFLLHLRSQVQAICYDLAHEIVMPSGVNGTSCSAEDFALSQDSSFPNIYCLTRGDSIGLSVR